MKATHIAHMLEEDNSDIEVDEFPLESASVDIHTNGVSVRQSPYLDTFYNHNHVRVTCTYTLQLPIICQGTL
jgi:hypothetical protein